MTSPANLVVIDGAPLSVDQVVRVAEGTADVALAPDLESRLQGARSVVEDVVANDRIVYGITTGFGALASTRIAPERADTLQIDLLRSHAAGVGDPLPAELVRAMLLLRARTLTQGHSGVRAAVVERLVDLLQRDLLPVVPGQGSVGASGDLAQFAHLALPVIGEGLLTDAGGPAEPAADVLARHGLTPIALRAKEGLSLLNGTEGMLSMGVFAVRDGRRLCNAADIACALSVEALMASSRPFDARIHQLRPHPGQIESARIIRELLDGSAIGASHADDFTHAVQDAYSVRCAPQVHGAVRDIVHQATAVFERELGSVVDNPIVFPDTGDVVSAGNFHGQPLAFSLDFLAIGMTEIGSISERRTDRILDPDRSSGLPPFLAAEPGINSGYMLSQYTAAALVAENKVLSHPASVESIPTSGLQEDHVSMGWGAGRKLREVITNTSLVLAVEVLCAVQGMDYRGPLRPAEGTAAAHAAIREVVPPLDLDRLIGGEIEAVAALMRDGSLDRFVPGRQGA